jgi:hypothetical protein
MSAAINHSGLNMKQQKSMYSAVYIPINLQNLIILAERFNTVKADDKVHIKHITTIIPIFTLGNMSSSMKRKPDTGCLYTKLCIGVQRGLC